MPFWRLKLSAKALPLHLRADISVVCYVTDRKSLLTQAGSPEPRALLDELARSIQNAIASGVDSVQIREKDLGGADLLSTVRAAVAATSGTAARIVVNDRPDVAVASGAAGVHLGGASLPVSEVRKWRAAGNAPADFLIGGSCHSLDAALAAAQEGADYLFFGPVFATPSKASFGAPQGLERLAEICRRVAVPVVAIGGIDWQTAALCLRAGAAGVAAIRLFQEERGAGVLRENVAELKRIANAE
jgi:thiamine-phosphate pyrophosphorylase